VSQILLLKFASTMHVTAAVVSF